MRSRVLLVTALLLCPHPSQAQTALQNCSAQFIGGDSASALVLANAPATNQHLCYRDDGTSFFATEYSPTDLAPIWAAYRLSPANYGANGCNTYNRAVANCYVREDTWAEFEACTSGSDPFHGDHMLTGTKLTPNDFSTTGHDRGHIAPRQAFSWHVCGTYQTFSMANMSPQRAFLNQNIWQFLERQVLTWAVDTGPIYVVTGVTYSHFPHEAFEAFEQPGLDPNEVYSSDTTMTRAVTRHNANFAAHATGHILRPKRDANPANVKAKVASMRMPTGYYKVIFRPARDTEPAHAIAFLLPHSYENLNMIVDFYENYDAEDAFWSFVSTIDVVEQTAGISFPGIPDSMKSGWGDDLFADSGRNIRANSCGRGTAQGVLPNSTKAERLAACTDLLN